MLFRSYCTLLFFFFSVVITAQFNNLKFENLGTSDGLSSSTCTEIFQDSEGFLWFGTIDGLNKYNGYEFEVFRSILNDSTSIGNNRIFSITEDKYKNLWVGTNNGLNLFDKKTNRFSRVNLYEQLSLHNSPRKIVNDLLYETDSNTLWVATNNGVIKIVLGEEPTNLETLNFSYYLNDASNSKSLANNTVNSIQKDKDNAIWFVTNGQHLNRYHPEKDNFDRIHIKSSKPYELNHIPKNVFIDSENDFWIGNDLSNLILWNTKKNSFEHISLIDYQVPISDFYQDKNGLIWLSTDGHGIFIFNKKDHSIQQQIVNDPFDSFSLPNNKPSAIYKDKNDVLWVGSYDVGVSKLDPSKYSFGHYYHQPNYADGLNAKVVQSVLQDSKERIWISAYNGGLNLFDEAQGSYRPYSHDPNNQNSLGSNKIMYSFESSDGHIWVCTLDGGLNKFNPEDGTVKRHLHEPGNLNSIGQNSVWTGIEDNKKRLWLGLRTEGLSMLDPEEQLFYNFKNSTGLNENGLASNSVICLYIDSKNRLLVGTSLGLNFVDLNALKDLVPTQIDFQEINEKGIEGNGINYITEDHLNNIWLGTDNGIFKLNTDLTLTKAYSSQDGLPNNLVVGIKEDDNHNLWITTKSGLSHLDPNSGLFRNFNLHDGLQGTEYQSKSIEKTMDGRILIGGINGFNIFHPDDITLRSATTAVPQITDFKLNNKKIVHGDYVNGRILFENAENRIQDLKLKYNENYLSFGFVALYFENPELVQYAYKMHGLDDEYVYVGSNRTVNLSNLEPGDYKFEVKASIDGQWEKAESSNINITIAPPFWKTWWMYLIYLIIAGAIFWLVTNYYTQKVKESQQHELDQMKLRFFVNVSHEFRTPLTLIMNPVEKILSNVTDYNPIKPSAITIQRSARRLLHLVNQLLDYRKMDVGMDPLQLEKGNIVKFCQDIFSLFEGLASKKEIEYKFMSDSKHMNTLFDFDKVEKIITNLISNAIKFTKNGGAILVSVQEIKHEQLKKKSLWGKGAKTGNFVEIVVEDTGVGLNKEQLKNVFSRFYNLDITKAGTGIGLNFTKALVELHGGKISVESSLKKGSKFTVLLPLKTKGNTQVVENVKNEFLINSMKAVEYQMSITDTPLVAKTPKEKTQNKKLHTILIVEDNKELRSHLCADLKDHYHIKEASNGEKGLKMVNKYYPDLIISDVMMPKMDGFEFCKKVKTEFDTCHIPVLLLTARSLEDDRIIGYNSGADSYLSKPFVTSLLKARISNLLETKARLRKRFSEIGGVIPSSEVTTNTIDAVFLDKATKIILENISDMDFKQDDLLQKMGIGRSQLYRKITSITGHNPSHFIRTVRLRHAADLLHQNMYTIKEVTYMVGFNSTAYFSKTFRELFKVTPTEFIEQKQDSHLNYHA